MKVTVTYSGDTQHNGCKAEQMISIENTSNGNYQTASEVQNNNATPYYIVDNDNHTYYYDENHDCIYDETGTIVYGGIDGMNIEDVYHPNYDEQGNEYC